jgi:hypothetical protein
MAFGSVPMACILLQGFEWRGAISLSSLMQALKSSPAN